MLTRCSVVAIAAVLLANALWPLVGRAAEIQVTKEAVPREGGQPARGAVFDFDTRKVRVRVLPSTTLARGQHPKSGVSVRDAASSLSVKELARRELLLVNGGFSGNYSDLPAGLLITDGRAVTIPNYTIRRGNPSHPCALGRVDTLRLSGLLCVAKGGELSVRPMADTKIDDCEQAIQAGPMLVRDGKPEICPPPSGETPYARTLVCEAGTRARIVVTLDPILLYDIAQWLARPAAEGGLGCLNAMNLSGDTSSGAMYVRSRGSGPSFSGPGTFPQASFLVVTPR
jgi:hypothetical protein